MIRTYEEVARRAYELFLARGRQHGGDLDDWLEAERQLTGSGTPAPQTRRHISAPRAAKSAAARQRRPEAASSGGL
jgi:hypothetical protein